MPIWLLKLAQTLLQDFLPGFLAWLGRTLRADWLRHKLRKNKKGDPTPESVESP